MRRFIRNDQAPGGSHESIRCRCTTCGAHVLQFSAATYGHGWCSTCGGGELEPVERQAPFDTGWRPIELFHLRDRQPPRRSGPRFS
jgi:hypothetical protein